MKLPIVNKISHKVTRLLWVWRTKTQVTQNLMTATTLLLDLSTIHNQNHEQQQIKYNTCIKHNLCQEILTKRLLQMTNETPRLPKHI